MGAPEGPARDIVSHPEDSSSMHLFRALWSPKPFAQACLVRALYAGVLHVSYPGTHP